MALSNLLQWTLLEHGQGPDGQEQMMSRGPFQPHPFCEPATLFGCTNIEILGLKTLLSVVLFQFGLCCLFVFPQFEGEVPVFQDVIFQSKANLSQNFQLAVVPRVAVWKKNKNKKIQIRNYQLGFGGRNTTILNLLVQTCSRFLPGLMYC